MKGNFCLFSSNSQAALVAACLQPCSGLGSSVDLSTVCKSEAHRDPTTGREGRGSGLVSEPVLGSSPMLECLRKKVPKKGERDPRVNEKDNNDQ
jgi:hypothetical protein